MYFAKCENQYRFQTKNKDMTSECRNSDKFAFKFAEEQLQVWFQHTGKERTKELLLQQTNAAHFSLCELTENWEI
jgi:hypothetical protein